ncbi:22288_t:CDS:2, partial [Gigaspora rosea]
DLTSTYSDNSTPSISSEDNIIESSTNADAYITKKHWTEVLHENQVVRQCKHCNKKRYSINTKDVDNSIIDLVVGTGISFNILNNPSFHRMVNKLHYVIDTYKVPHPTTISRHLSGSIYEIRFNFIKEVIAKMPYQISLTCDIFSLTMNNTTMNKAAIRMLQEELSNIDLISIGCMCYILNLIVNAGLVEINKLQQKVHKIMKYLSNPLANGCLELLDHTVKLLE